MPQPPEHKVNSTCPKNKGLTSADRSNKATLPLTVPVPIQVVCKGFIPAHIMIAIRGQTLTAFPP
ncbi:hypothetical protein CC2G_015281 [Coprinopsis cinerea AmutBmut pab1-1]|nr:hypothetical protein CC2G_006741 [Coprinopsis cinerea AmutBmut pab1-1]KAG2007587.1 hypothetical protein CC2G_015281 [Coprinopsis cinerea AmutBmut pab1-1]